MIRRRIPCYRGREDDREPRGNPGNGARRIGWHQSGCILVVGTLMTVAERGKPPRRRPRTHNDPMASTGPSPSQPLSLLPMHCSREVGSWSASTGRRDCWTPCGGRSGRQGTQDPRPRGLCLALLSTLGEPPGVGQGPPLGYQPGGRRALLLTGKRLRWKSCCMLL